MIRGAAILFLCGALISCSREPDLEIKDLDGVYFSNPCPGLKINDGSIMLDNITINGNLINIKGDNILATRKSVFFQKKEEECLFIIDSSPIYNYIVRDGEHLSIQILSFDRSEVRFFKKAAK